MHVAIIFHKLTGGVVAVIDNTPHHNEDQILSAWAKSNGLDSADHYRASYAPVIPFSDLARRCEPIA